MKRVKLRSHVLASVRPKTTGFVYRARPRKTQGFVYQARPPRAANTNATTIKSERSKRHLVPDDQPCDPMFAKLLEDIILARRWRSYSSEQLMKYLERACDGPRRPRTDAGL